MLEFDFNIFYRFDMYKEFFCLVELVNYIGRKIEYYLVDKK